MDFYIWHRQAAASRFIFHDYDCDSRVSGCGGERRLPAARGASVHLFTDVSGTSWPVAAMVFGRGGWRCSSWTRRLVVLFPDAAGRSLLLRCSCFVRAAPLPFGPVAISVRPFLPFLLMQLFRLKPVEDI